MSLIQRSDTKFENHLYDDNNFLKQDESNDPATKPLTPKSLGLLKLLLEGANQQNIYVINWRQADLARSLKVSRQALSIHFRKLRQMGLVQVGRGFINITQDGLRAAGHNMNPVVVTVRLSPQKLSEGIKRIKELPANEILRVTGDFDVVMVVEQRRLDHVLAVLSEIDGNLETKSHVSIEVLK